MKKYLFICFYVLANLCQAQFADSLRTLFDGKRSLDFGFDTRNSFLENKRLGVQCVKMGVDFGKKITIGVGYAWLNPATPIYDKYALYDKELKHDTSIYRQVWLHYVCSYINYIYYKSKRWEFSVPLQVGIGKLGYKYQYKGGEKRDNGGFCFLYEPEVNVKFKALKWLGVEGDVGYRLLFQQNHFIKNTFNSPLFSLGIFIVWNEVALMAFPKNAWVEKQLGPSRW